MMKITNESPNGRKKKNEESKRKRFTIILSLQN